MTRRALRGFDPNALRERRIARNLSRGDLARKADIAVETLWAWENERASPQVDKLARVAQALGTTIRAFVHVPKQRRTLADLRVRVGMTQPELAKATRMSTTALHSLERGESKLTDEKKHRLAPVLGVSADEIEAAYQRARNRPPGAPA